jgi:hypothetical protein
MFIDVSFESNLRGIQCRRTLRIDSKAEPISWCMDIVGIEGDEKISRWPQKVSGRFLL